MRNNIADIDDYAQTCRMNRSLSEELRSDRRAALRSYSASLLSNSKWKAVFSILAKEDLCILQVMARFIGVADEKAMALPSLNAPHAFVDSFAFGPFPLINLEWIEVPAIAAFPRGNNLPAEKFAQNLGAVQSALLAVGKQFPLERTSAGLRIIGHIRSAPSSST